ncbi:MAG: uroporphyrinogen decarboxylase family protein [Kiritimatiellales bacterium]|jgi:uroporphyrinogen decarboxylase
MNGYERIQAAMRGGQPDRVPVMLHNFMPAAREAGFSQREFGTDPEKAAQAFIQAAEKYDLDGIIMDLDTATIAGALGVPVDFPDDAPARCERGLLKSLADLDALDVPNVGRNEHLQVWLETMRLLKAHFGNEKYLRGSVDQAPFSMASMLRTPAEWLYDLMDDEQIEPAHRLLDYCTQASCQFIRLMAGAGAHMVATGDSPAGPDMISPAMYREFARPYEDRLAECAHACGMPYLLHICGNTTAILDQFVGRRLDAVELDYKTDMRRVHETLKNSGVAFWGNIDPSGVLARGTPETVHRETIRLIEQFAGTPRFVLNSGCALPSAVPEENIRTFLSAAGRTVAC